MGAHTANLAYQGLRFYKGTRGYWESTGRGGDRRKLQQVVWDTHFPGTRDSSKHHVHHIDEDKDNNSIDNLELLTPKQHMDKHPDSLDKAREAAKVWHGSDEGYAWHKKHGVESWGNRKFRLFLCEQCGSVYETRDGKDHKFCSNACKTRARFESGVDDVDRICVTCGKSFTINRYRKTVNCTKKCSARANWASRKK